jgi:hypothetical protein
MITILSAKKTTSPKNRYKITHDWMLGDSDGNTTSTQLINKHNPHLDRFLSCCNKLTKSLPGTWANILDTSTIEKCLDDDDFEFFGQFIDEFNSDDEDIQELYFEVITEQGHTFVSYQGFEVVYYDENGNKFNCKWTQNK